MTTWHKGPPPSIGWWPASYWQDRSVLRWWNGKWWSYPAAHWMNAKDAATHAEIAEDARVKIEWTDRPDDWPERSRT